MNVQSAPFATSTLPWYKKPLPRLVVLTDHKPETVFLALSIKDKNKFYGINLSSLKTTYPAREVDTYELSNFSEYTGLITLSND